MSFRGNLVAKPASRSQVLHAVLLYIEMAAGGSRSKRIEVTHYACRTRQQAVYHMDISCANMRKSRQASFMS